MNKKNNPLKKYKPLSILLIILIFFFGLQLLSRVLSVIGSYTDKPLIHQTAAVSFPIEAEPFYRYGHTQYWAARKRNPINKEQLKQAITYFQKAIAANRFYYRPHFFLGKAYLLIQPQTVETVNKGLSSLKRAVRLQGGRDKTMTSSVLRSMLDHWNYLTEDDKKLSHTLLRQVIKDIDPDIFEGILESWQRQSGDISIFEGVLSDAPHFYHLAADALTRAQVNMELRRVYKLNHEIYTLDTMKDEFKTLSRDRNATPEQFLELRKKLKDGIIGYYRQIPNNHFKKQTYIEIIKALDFRILGNYLREYLEAPKPEQRQVLDDFVRSTINDLMAGKDYEEFLEFLEKQNYFSINDLGTEYIKGMLFYNMRDYSTVISRLETLRVSDTFTGNSKKQKEVLLLLTDAYIDSRLMTKAYEVLTDIGTLSPNSRDLHLRRMRIENVIGRPSLSPKERELRERRDKAIQDSRIIDITQLSMKTDVFLTTQNEIVIRLAENLEETLKAHRLLQVFIDGNIGYECYLNKLPHPVIVKAQPFERFTRVTLRIEIK